MARPIKNNAEWFSHDADMRNDLKIKALRRKFGHEGYAVWCFLLETLTHENFFEVELSDVNKELLAVDYDISTERFDEIVDMCVRIGLFQVEHNKLSCPALNKRLGLLVNDRERRRNIYRGRKEVETDISGGENPEEKGFSDISTRRNPIVKESKEKDNTVETLSNDKDNTSAKSSTRFVPPTTDQVRDYIAEMGYTIDAEQFVAYYESNGWMIGRNKMKSWRAACTNWERMNKERSYGSNNSRRADRGGAGSPTADDYPTSL